MMTHITFARLRLFVVALLDGLPRWRFGGFGKHFAKTDGPHIPRQLISKRTTIWFSKKENREKELTKKKNAHMKNRRVLS